MAWQRSGDTGATYPKLMAVRGDRTADERTVNEIAGYIWRLSMQSGAHLTDYILDIGTIELFGGPRTPELVRIAVRYGLLTKVKTANGAGYKIIDDPDFIHLRSRADVEWSRQQRADTRDLALIVPVRKRDGDNCRWCGFEVVWRGTKTKFSGEYDHLVRGQPGTVETMVVACRGCNSSRGVDTERWDSEHQLRPVPTAPRYGRWTAKLLTENGYPTTPTTEHDDAVERPAPAPGADTAPTRVRPATGQADDPAPAPPRAQQSPPARRELSSNSVRSDIEGPTERVVSGRVGSGTGGASGRDGSGTGGASGRAGPGGVSRRRRRGRRGGGGGRVG